MISNTTLAYYGKLNRYISTIMRNHSAGPHTMPESRGKCIVSKLSEYWNCIYILSYPLGRNVVKAWIIPFGG
jgi:hypothetical protein